MAEIIGPISFCFGAIGFVFATVPTVAKAGKIYVECSEHFRSLELQAVRIHSKYRAWEINMRGVDYGRHEEAILAGREGVRLLQKEIRKELDRQRMTPEEKVRWYRTRHQLQRGIFSMSVSGAVPHEANSKSLVIHAKERWNKTFSGILRALPHEDDMFKRSFFYTIWKSAIIEGWLGRMEKYFEVMNSSATLELILGSTNQINASSDETKLRRFTRVREFVDGFSSLAQTVHQQCSAIPSTSGWLFSLGKYSKGFNITTLEFLTWIGVELRFSAIELEEASKFQLRVPFDKYAPKAHGDGQRIRQLVSYSISGNEVPNIAAPASSDPVFVSWGTEWTKRLCCFGIHVETPDSTNAAQLDVFVTEKHNLDACNHTHEDFCLKRLGLLLVKILLATPLRMSDTNAAKPYEQMSTIENNTWRPVDRRELEIQLSEKMLDELVPAMNFCLEEDSQLVNIEYSSSLLYWCNDQVCERVNKWYEGEGLTHERMSAYLQSHPENPRPQSKRPKTPFHRRGTLNLNVSTDNVDENAPQHAERSAGIDCQVIRPNQEPLLQDSPQDSMRLVLTHVYLCFIVLLAAMVLPMLMN